MGVGGRGGEGRPGGEEGGRADSAWAPLPSEEAATGGGVERKGAGMREEEGGLLNFDLSRVFARRRLHQPGNVVDAKPGAGYPAPTDEP